MDEALGSNSRKDEEAEVGWRERVKWVGRLKGEKVTGRRNLELTQRVRQKDTGCKAEGETGGEMNQEGKE